MTKKTQKDTIAKRNPIARELATAKYTSKVVKSKKNYKRNGSKEDVQQRLTE